MNKYFTFYTVTEQSDLSENMTSRYAFEHRVYYDGLWTDDSGVTQYYVQDINA